MSRLPSHLISISWHKSESLKSDADFNSACAILKVCDEINHKMTKIYSWTLENPAVLKYELLLQ